MADILANLGSFILEKKEEADPTNPRRSSHEGVMDLIYIVSIWLLPVLIAITFHEAAHGYVARFLGDETASRLGRVSLNPLRHIDPLGTIASARTFASRAVTILVWVRQTGAG